jgi:hypothetical protein
MLFSALRVITACQRRAEAEDERERQGEKRCGRTPKAVEARPTDKAQLSFMDAELHMMQTHNKGRDDCGHAQARVDKACQIILACDVTDAPSAQPLAAPRAQATARYARRQVIVEPVLAQIKENRGCRCFWRRGLKKIRGKWSRCVGPTIGSRSGAMGACRRQPKPRRNGGARDERAFFEGSSPSRRRSGVASTPSVVGLKPNRQTFPDPNNRLS